MKKLTITAVLTLLTASGCSAVDDVVSDAKNSYGNIVEETGEVVEKVNDIKNAVEAVNEAKEALNEVSE